MPTAAASEEARIDHHLVKPVEHVDTLGRLLRRGRHGRGGGRAATHGRRDERAGGVKASGRGALRPLVEGVSDYAIFMLDPQGHVATWNAGAERIKGYKAEEIIGQHFSRFYPAGGRRAGLARATSCGGPTAEGRFEDEGWRVRKDGSRFWANVVITALRDDEPGGCSGLLEGHPRPDRAKRAEERCDGRRELRTGPEADAELARRTSGRRQRSRRQAAASGVAERRRAEAASGGRPAQGRVPGHARPRAPQPAGPDPQRPAAPEDAGGRPTATVRAGARA